MKTILLAAALLFCSVLHAQLSVTNYRLNTGTAANSVAFDMNMGANSEPWFASNTGIRIRNANGTFRGTLLGIDTRKLAVHSANMWVATFNNGVYVYPNSVSTNMPMQYLPAQTGINNVTGLAVFDEKIWICGSNGLAYLDLAFNPMPVATTGWTPVPNTTGTTAIYANSNQLWVATPNGVFNWLPGSGLQPAGITGLPAGLRVNDMFAEPNGALWLATGSGLFYNHNSVSRSFGAFSGFRSNDITAVGIDAQGDVWAGSNGSAYRKTFNGWAQNSLVQLQTGEKVYFIKNFAGITWLGTNTKAIMLNPGFGRNLVENGSFEDFPYSVPSPTCVLGSRPSPFDMCAWNGPLGPNSYINGWLGHPSMGLPFEKDNGVFLLNKKFPYRLRNPTDAAGCSQHCGFNLPNNSFGTEVNAYHPNDMACLALDGASGVVGKFNTPLAAKLYELNMMAAFYSCNHAAGLVVSKNIKLELTLGTLDANNLFVPVNPTPYNNAPFSVARNGQYWNTGDISIDLTRFPNPARITHFKLVNQTPSGNENLGRIYIDQFCLRERPAVVPRYNSYVEAITIGCSDTAFIGPAADGPGNMYVWTGNPDASPYNRQVYVRLQPGQTRNLGLTIIRADQFRTVLDTLTTYNYTVTRLPGLNITINRVPGPNSSIAALNPVVTGGSGNYTYVWTRPGNWGTVSGSQFPGNLLCRGIYTLQVTDVETGCSQTISYNFNEANYATCAAPPRRQ